MNYLVSLFDCVLYADKTQSVVANVKYKIEAEEYVLVFSSSSIPFVFSLKEESENLKKVKNGFDNYYFLFPTQFPNLFCSSFSFKNKKVEISLFSKLIVTIDGNKVCEEDVCNISYAHYEIIDDICLIYFVGNRNYLVVLKSEELFFANYYDECNVKDNEKYFMCRLCDSLNHGIVCHIKDKDIKKYLVYLDDEELRLKNQFIPFVFLDCVKAENFKYCNSMLSEDLKLKDEKEIKKFFPVFDYYYPINSQKFVLINKNTLAGIYEFDIKNNLIVNISVC